MFIRWKHSDREIEVRRKGPGHEWYYRTIARSNGKVIHTSETYSSRHTAIEEADKESKDTGRKVVVVE